MVKTIFTAGLVTLFAGALSLGACGSDNEPLTSDDGGPGGGPGFGSDGGSADTGGFAGCAKSTKKAEKLPVDMILGLDTSFSMDFDSKWPNVRDALKSFVSNPAYADLGL